MSLRSKKLRWILCGFAILLTGSYFDNARGPLLPVLRQVFQLSYKQVSWFLVAGYLASVVCTFALIPLSRRWRPAHLSFAVCALGVVTALSAPQIHGFVALLLLAAGLGASVAALGAMANILVLEGTAGRDRARFFCGLHAMYGFGSLLGPAAASWLFARHFPWSQLLVIGAPPLIVLAGFSWAGLPPVGGVADPLVAEAVAAGRRLSWCARQRGLLVVFALYVGAEVMTSSWLVTFLVETRPCSVAAAAPVLSGFFVMMALSRLACFLRIAPRWESWAMTGSLTAAAACFLIGRAGWAPAFALSGILGPVFPLLLARMSREFPREAPTLTYWIITTVQFTLSLCNLGVGYLTDRFGIRVSYWVPAGFYALTLAVMVPYLWDRRIRPGQPAAA